MSEGLKLLDRDWTPINRVRDYLKERPNLDLIDLDWDELEDQFRLDCIEDIGGYTPLEITTARSTLGINYERLQDLLEARYDEVWNNVTVYALRTMWLKLDREFKEEERNLMRIKMKLVDSAIKTEKTALAQYAHRYSYVSEQAHKDALDFGKDVIDFENEIIIPLYQRTGVNLLDRYPLKTPFSDISKSFERKVIYELGKGPDRYYRPISYLRWHHGFKLGAEPRIPADPVSGFVKGNKLFDPNDEVRIWMYQRSRLNILLDRLEDAIRKGLI